jgi:hypothetical protein
MHFPPEPGFLLRPSFGNLILGKFICILPTFLTNFPTLVLLNGFLYFFFFTDGGGGVIDFGDGG